jgi:hypothetical protein
VDSVGRNIAAARLFATLRIFDPAVTERSVTMKKYLAAAAVIGLIAGVSAPAFAFSCPKDMKAIDAALAAKPSLSAEQMKKVKTLRSQGEAEHKAGKHQASLDHLHEAMAILGIGK